jgi:HlyD family secretion protein
MKKILLISCVVVVLLGVGAFVFLRGNGKEAKFRTEKVTKGDIVMTVTATGTVNAVITVQVGTQVSGTIKSLYVDFNSHVKKGQLIAQIDPSLFEEQVAQSKANLLASKANLEKAEATLVDAKRTRDRNKDLVSKGLIAQSDFDTSDTNYETAKAGVSAARASVGQSDAALKNAHTNLGYTRIVSPVDGTVVSRNVDVGQTVAASFQTPTLFTIAQDLTKMQIDTSVDEADIGKVKTWQEVDFTVDAYPDITFKGKVWQIRNAPITVQNVVTYDVVIQVNNPDLKLKPGMTANVSIVVDRKKDVLKIPNAALRFKPSGKSITATGKRTEKKGPGVWILDKDNSPKRIPVSLGISDGSFTELVSGEIREEQELIVESLSKENVSQTSGPRMRMF